MKQVTVGIIGCGKISNIYVKNISKFYTQLKIVACADIFIEKANEMAETYHIDKACSVEELLQDDGVDIVLNLTIPQAHYEINKKAILNGKNVYCEKPLSLTTTEAEELVALAKENGVMLGCAPDTFLGASIQTCRRLIDEGWIGRPIGATANMLDHGVETWHPSPEFYYQFGGGPIWDMGPYYITALVSLLGPVAETCSFSTKAFQQRKIYSQQKRGKMMDVEVPTHYAGILKFSNGIIANINMSFDVWYSSLPNLEIYGTEGTLIVPDPNLFGGEVKVLRGENILDLKDIMSDKKIAGGVSKNDMEECLCTVPSLYRLPSNNMRGIGLLDMAYAITENRENRAGAELSCHVTEVLENLASGSGVASMRTCCERPKPLPIGYDIGELD